MNNPGGTPFPGVTFSEHARCRLHHVGIVVPNLEQAVTGYTMAFEFIEHTIPFDDHAQRVRVAFVRVGIDAWLEFIEPVGPASPVTQFLAKTRGGYHHVAFEVSDIEGTVRECEAAGARVVCQPVIGFEGRRVAFLFPKLQPSLLTEFVEPRPKVVGTAGEALGAYGSSTKTDAERD